MPHYPQLVTDARRRIDGIAPRELAALIERGTDMLLLDVRQRAEFSRFHIPGAINVPRGVLETACEWGYDITVAPLAEGRERLVVVISATGERSALAAEVMVRLGFQRVVSLTPGLLGWHRNGQPLTDELGRTIARSYADTLLAPTTSARPLP